MNKRTAARANPCLLVMDAGGTHTRALVVTPEGVRLGAAEAGPANSFLVGVRLEVRNIRDAARAALASAGVPESSVAAAVIGSASVDFDGLWGAPIETPCATNSLTPACVQWPTPRSLSTGRWAEGRAW